MRAVPFNILAFGATLSMVVVGVFVAFSTFPTKMVGSEIATAIEWGFVGAALTFWIPGVLSQYRSVAVLVAFGLSVGLAAGVLAYMWADLMASV